MTTRPILVGYDQSPGAKAAAWWALDEGARTGTPVQLAYAFEWLPVAAPITAPRIWPDDAARRDIQAILDAFIAEAAEARPEVPVTGLILEGVAAFALQEQSRHASLVVLGSRGHGGFAGLLVGSTTVAVTAHAHCPVVVVRGVEPGPEMRLGHVAVGVDFSPGSLLALEFAFAQAASRRVNLHVVRAWTPPNPRWSPPGTDLAEFTVAERAAVDEMLAGWQAKYPAVTVTAEVVADSPAHCLVNASRNAQLVIVGSRGRGGFLGLLLGSVSQQLLHHSHCPVAIVREVPAEDGAGR
jgi:nucleotide-binding universal stress UspA family protein